eukprot:CAMPEP_0170735428 /NCGR_PEP_ID=MMETSP0437-20130122/3091_1 /TAXON_ID=0 /ORGANISM="Sexangularia sp." /LENGTH=121 /DNA_ID=CAMNT_0011073753 /DNA_START=787 /DNA_END=1149 /DNA_ORIENTATION=-
MPPCDPKRNMDVPFGLPARSSSASARDICGKSHSVSGTEDGGGVESGRVSAPNEGAETLGRAMGGGRGASLNDVRADTLESTATGGGGGVVVGRTSLNDVRADTLESTAMGGGRGPVVGRD